MSLDSLSNDDGHGNENVTQKVNSHNFKLHRSYSSHFNLRFCQEWNSKGMYLSSQKEKKIVVLCLRPIKRKIRKFHVEVVQRRQSNVQKRGCTLACEQAFLFGRAKRVSRERTRERRSREGQGPLARAFSRGSLAQIGELARRLDVRAKLLFCCIAILNLLSF